MKYCCALLVLVLALSGCTRKPESFEELMAAGKKAFVDKEYSVARGYLGRAIAQNPSDHDGLYFLGLAYARDYLLDSAYFYLGRADVLYAHDREINLELLSLARALKDDEVTIRAIGVLVATGDPESQYWENLAALQAKVGNYYNAYHYARRLLEADPENRNWYLGAATAAANIDSIHVSLRILDSALEKFGPLPELRTNRATFLIADQRYTEAEQLLRALHTEDTASVAIRINLANVLATQDDRQKKLEALKMYKQLALLDMGQLNIDSVIVVLEKEVE